MSITNELIEQAIIQGKEGNKLEAKMLLAQVVKQEPQNARAWYLLSQVVDNQEQSIYCLSKALEIEPDNAQVKRRLQATKGEKVDSTSIQPPKLQKLPASTKKIKKPFVKVVLFTGLSVVLVCCILSVIALVSSEEDEVAQISTEVPVEVEQQITEVLNTQEPVLLPPINTEIPTEIPIPSLTPIPALESDGRPACIPPNTVFEVGLVTSIVDGDTIHALINGQDYSVRYIGIDAPEANQEEAYSNESTAKNRELVENRTIILARDVSETDRYGRLLRYVFIDDVAGLFVNYELVRLGYAYAVTYQPDSSCAGYFESAQQFAQNNLAGFWGDFSLRSITVIPSLTPLSTTASGGGTAPCNCTGPDKDCKDFGTRTAAQRCFDYCKSQGYGDIFRLDGDGDGKVCESMP